MAFNQIGILVAGLVMAVLGAVFIIGHYNLGNDVKKVKATIIGVRSGVSSIKTDGVSQGSAVYYPVFEYTGPDGTKIQAESDGGSSLLADKIPGSEITVGVFAKDPHKARVPGRLLLILGVIFFAIGVFIIRYALTAYPFTPFSAAAAAGMVLWSGLKIKKFVKPRDQWETPTQFMERRMADFKAKREAMPILERGEVMRLLREQDTLYLKWMPLYFAIALGLCAIGYYTGNTLNRMLMEGVRAEGRVVDMEESSDSDGGHTYYAVVEFRTGSGVVERFRDNVGTNPPIYYRGDDVTVVYMPDEAAEAMIDRGGWNWIVPGLMFGFGGLMLFFTTTAYFRIKDRRMRSGWN